ncbi:MAG: hypothetical protein LBB81_11890 [Treponema sp.]|jgi:hypothetical protein|nr:hypothetical protein [Treponema sp.]
MKKMLKFSALVLIVGLVFGLTGCDDDPNKGKGTTVSFESFSPPSIYVDNKSGERLIAFKGSLNPNNLISGIPAYATNHGLAKTSSVNNTLFTTTGDFALILITEAQYNQNKNNLASAAVFAEIYAFYNHEATNNNRFQISSKSGGSGRITLNNPTNWNIEIRKDGPTGEVLGYVAAQMTNTVLRVNAPDDYRLYPVFKRYVASEKEIYETVPKYTEGALTGQPYAKNFSLETANGTSSWNLGELSGLVNMSLSSGSFYLKVNNNSNTAVMFYRGDDIQLTSTGLKGIPPANSRIYSVKITRNPDGTYPNTSDISQLKIGTEGNQLSITTSTFKLDYIYTINVTGASESVLALGEMTESDEPLDVEAIFGH